MIFFHLKEEYLPLVKILSISSATLFGTLLLLLNPFIIVFAKSLLVLNSLKSEDGYILPHNTISSLVF
jgi:hypothetical protein